MVNNISGIKNIMLVSTILEIRHDFFLKITFLIFQYIPVHHQDFPVQIFSSTQKGSFPVHFSFQYIPVHLRNSSTQWPPCDHLNFYESFYGTFHHIYCLIFVYFPRKNLNNMIGWIFIRVSKELFAFFFYFFTFVHFSGTNSHKLYKSSSDRLFENKLTQFQWFCYATKACLFTFFKKFKNKIK